ncbi:uncharacterized protein BXZ73DRAFT_74684 [Epithele typhae]|uniref:uncharacterized protein n=1 Tax=Epithele typhae TaxID=378194 RepID=UPI002008C916|nr:uncharacterized protein BXZ73DRAFT_74684 [Epithele typhae]KAH9942422.1 hypothetical protein BXZ73DRAFT_74684 [Epithele typhae]
MCCALRKASPTFAAVIVWLEMQYPKLYIDMGAPPREHFYFSSCDEHMSRDVSTPVKHFFMSLDNSYIKRWTATPLKNRAFAFPASLQTCKSVTMRPSRTFMESRPAYENFRHLLSIKFPALTHLHLDTSLFAKAAAGGRYVFMLGAVPLPALVFLRLSHAPECKCVALEGDLHDERCVFFGVVRACPRLSRIQLDVVGTLVEAKLPRTVRQLTIVARRVQVPGYELKSTFVGYNIVVAVREGLFRNLGVRGRGVVRKVEVLSSTEEIIALDRVRDACAEHGIVVERVLEDVRY